MRKISFVACLIMLPVVAFGAVAKKQSAIQNGTNVRGRVAATGIYSQECYDAYYGCMDEFCISDNINGGSCLCSNDNAKYEDELKEINEMLAEAARIRDVEVEKIKLGSNVDIVFGGGRTYDAKGNVVYNLNNDKPKASKNNREDLLKLFDTNFIEEDEVDEDDIMNKTGAALFNAANETCKKQVGPGCEKDMTFLRQTYARQIESDCRGFANSIAQQRAAAQSEMNNAEREVRTALKESFDSANKYNQGECMVELKKCMTGADACGTDWIDCVSTVASENMQNLNLIDSVAGTKVKKTVRYNISASVMERLESKRAICERVLDQCMAVRDNVWDAFLREAAPTLKLAELRAESNMRQSCLTDITQCLHKACKDDIAGKGVATMDSCLSRPEMARSFCKNQIEPCERMAGDDLWSYVRDKLLAMRVDSCTAEVKACFMDENRCGADFMNCIGMDYEFIHKMCPLDTLVACKGYKGRDGNSEFSMADIDDIIMGLYLNIDNKALENCQKLVETKMTEICGSTTDCNRFASDDTIGTGSLFKQKDHNVYRLTGMISFGALKISTVPETYGHVEIDEYMDNVKKYNEKVDNYEGISAAIRSELENIAGNINRVIDMIAQDEKIKYCVEGRDLSQITGQENKTAQRFPNLLNQIKMQIAIAALRQAQNNYQARYNELLTKATKDASADVAQYLCQMLPVSGGAPVDGSGLENETTSLNPPYAISYEVGAGLNDTLLARGGHGTFDTTGAVRVDNLNSKKTNGFVQGLGAAVSLGASLGVDALAGAGGKSSYEIPGGTREMWSTFNRETRICRLCSSTVTRDCNHLYKRGFLGIGHKDETNCTESEPIEKCDDIEM